MERLRILIDRFHNELAIQDYESAKNSMKEIARICPNLTTSWYLYGCMLEKLNDYSGACYAFEHVYDLDHWRKDALDRAAYNAVKMESIDIIARIIKKEIICDPNFINVLNNEPYFADIVNKPEIRSLYKFASDKTVDEIADSYWWEFWKRP
jgi:tetratricopeptide (TPR) repeat protein